MNVESGIQIAELRAIARRRGKVAGAVAGFALLAVYWLAMGLTNQYQSYATILVEPQSVSPDLVQAGVRESDLTERLHLMTAQILSRPRLSRMIDQFELYQEEAEDKTREEVIDLMREAVRVEPVIPELERAGRRAREAEINQFRIFFYDPDPKVARDVAQRMANDFIEEHINERVKISQKSLEFIEGELDRISQRMTEIEADVAKVKAENPGRLPEDMNANQHRLDRLMDAIARAQHDYDLARSDEAFWRSQYVAAGTMGGGTKDDTSPFRRAQLLELQIAELRARGFTEKHPDYIKAKVELDGLRAAIATREVEAEQVETPPNFAQQTAEAERHRAELQMESAREEIDRLQVSAEQFQTLLAEAPRVAEKLDGLGRVYQSQLDGYQTYIVRRQEAGVQADMERRQLGEQFRVLEAAFIAPEPSSPNRILLIALGAVFAVVAGLGLGLLLEATDTSLHTARQLQADLSIPVLAAIPQIWLESDRVASRRRALRQAFASVGVALFMLAGGAATYGWVNGMPGFAKEFLGIEEEASEEESAPPAGPEG
jgi:polysaccharide chain length determinant protein (PEP-CTERM system associated)